MKNKRTLLLISATATLGSLTSLAFSAQTVETSANTRTVPSPSSSSETINWIKSGQYTYSDTAPSVTTYEQQNRNPVLPNFDDRGVFFDDTINSPVSLEITSKKGKIENSILNNDAEDYTVYAKFNIDPPHGTEVDNWQWGLVLSSDLEYVPNSNWSKGWNNKWDSNPKYSKQIAELTSPNVLKGHSYVFNTQIRPEKQNEYLFFDQNNIQRFISKIAVSNSNNGGDPKKFFEDEIMGFSDDQKRYFRDNFSGLGRVIAFQNNRRGSNFNGNNRPVTDLVINVRKKIEKTTTAGLLNEKGNLKPTNKSPRSFIGVYWSNINVDNSGRVTPGFHKRMAVQWYDRSKYRQAQLKNTVIAKEVKGGQIPSELGTPKFEYKFYYGDLQNPIGSMQFTDQSYLNSNTKTANFSFDGEKYALFNPSDSNIKNEFRYYDKEKADNFYLEIVPSLDETTGKYSNNFNFWFSNDWYREKNRIISQVSNTPGWNKGRRDSAVSAMRNSGELKFGSKTETPEQLRQKSTISNYLLQSEYTGKIFNDILQKFDKDSGDNQAIKNQIKYVNASDEKKRALDNLLGGLRSYYLDNGTRLAVSGIAQLNGQQMKKQFDDAVRAINQLDGVERLEEQRRKTQAIFDTAHWISDNELKPKLQQEIKSATRIKQLEDLIPKITKLDGYGRNLYFDIQDAATVKETDNYKHSDQNLKTAFDNALNKLKEYTGTDNKIKKEDTANLDNALTEFDLAKKALNGNSKLPEAKRQLKDEINRMQHLTQNQKQKLSQMVDDARTFDKLEEIKNIANTLNTNMGVLKDAVQQAKTAKATQNYEDASNKTDFDKKLAAAEQALANSNNNTINPSEISTLKTNLENAKNALDGTTRLNQAKNSAKSTINALNNLNNKQKHNLISEVDSARNITSVNEITNKARTLDNSMKSIKEKLEGLKSGLETNTNYTQSDPAKKNAFDQKVTEVENLIKSTGENKDNAGVMQLQTELLNAYGALNGNTQLAKSKEDALRKLASLTNINDAQRQNIRNNINMVKTESEVTNKINEGTKLDTKMGELKALVDKANKAKETSNYKQATNKNAFDTALQTATNTIAKQTGSNLNQSQVQQAIDNLNNELKALDGDSRIENKRQELNQDLATKKYLNNAQINDFKSKITQATTIEQLTSLKTQYTDLDNKMKDLSNLKELYKNVTNTVKYTNSETSLKTAFDTKKKETENATNKTQGTNLDINAVQNLINSTKQAYENLNGDASLKAAKKEAKSTIDGLNNLTQNQKTALKNAIDSDDVQTNQAVKKLVDKAKILNEKMNELKNTITRANNTTKELQKYIDAQQDKKDAFDEAVSTAETFANLTSGTNLTELEKVKEQIEAIKTAEEKLDGEAQLALAKKNAIDNLDANYPHLNKAQKNNLKDKINSAKSKSELQTLLDNAKKIDNAMKTLTEKVKSIQDKNVKAMQKYTNASQEKKEAFDNALSEATALTNTTSDNNQNASLAEVLALTGKLSNTLSELDGDRALIEARENALRELEKLQNINEAQKTALKNAINEAVTIPNIQSELQKAKDLDAKMLVLANAIRQANRIKQTANYTEASEPKIQEFDRAFNSGDNKAAGENKSIAQIDQILRDLANAISNLDGDALLAAEKTKAKNAIDQLQNLTNAQKQALKNKIDAPETNTKAKVSNILEQAKSLNEIMKQFSDAIKQVDQNKIKESTNYKDADADKKAAYDLAYSQSVETLKSTDNINPAEIKNVLDEFNNKTQALNGDEKFESLKRQLENELANDQSYKNSQLYNLAKTELQEAYKQAINNANQVKNQNNFNHSQVTYQELKNLYDNIIKAKEAILNDALDAEGEIRRLPNLSESEKQSLINQLHAHPEQKNEIVQIARKTNDDKQVQIDKIQDLTNLSEQDKNNFINQLINTNAKDQVAIDHILNSAIAADNLTKEINDLLNSLADNFDKNKANQTRDKINELNNLTGNVSDQNALLNKLIEVDNIKELIDTFNNTNFDDTNINELLEKLNNLVIDNLETSIPALSSATQKVNEKARVNLEISKAVADLFKALQSNDNNLLKEANRKLNQLNITNNNKFVSDLNPEQEQLLDIFKKDILDVTQEDIEKLAAVDTEDISNVLKTLYKNKLDNLKDAFEKVHKKDSLQWPWWAGLAATIAALIATIAGLFKTKK